MGRKTFHYEASWGLRKCTECLSENDALLTSEISLRAEQEQCLALGSSQATMAQVRATLVLKMPKLGRVSVPQSRPLCGMINILYKGGPVLWPMPVSHLPIHPKGDAHCRLAVGQKPVCFMPGFWEMTNGAHSTCNNSAPWSCAKH